MKWDGCLGAGDLLRALTLPARGWEVSVEGGCVASLGSKRDARGWHEEPKVLLHPRDKHVGVVGLLAVSISWTLFFTNGSRPLGSDLGEQCLS